MVVGGSFCCKIPKIIPKGGSLICVRKLKSIFVPTFDRNVQQNVF